MPLWPLLLVGAVVQPGAYFGVAPATGAMATALLDTADHHRVWLLVQTSGQARIRLYSRFGFVVVTVPDPVTAHREPRVFMMRQPASTDGKLIEADPALWQRHRPGRLAGGHHQSG